MKWKGIPTAFLTKDIHHYALKITAPLTAQVFRDRLVLSKHQLLQAKYPETFIIGALTDSIRAVIYQALRDENLDEDEVNFLVTIQKQPPTPEYGEVAYDSIVVRVYEDMKRKREES